MLQNWYFRAASEYGAAIKNSLPVTGLGNRGSWKVLNGSELIVNESEQPLGSFRIFSGPLFYKQGTGGASEVF